VLKTPRRLLVIFNPVSGRGGRAERRLPRVVAELEAHGCVVVVRRTERPGDAERLAREAEPDFDLLVAAGGDGTINEVVNGLAAAPRPFAVIPLGTANVLAYEVGLPRSPRGLAALIAEGRPQPVWPACAGGRLFLMMLGIGFDADVLRRVDWRLKRRFGKGAFLWPILAAWLFGRPQQFTVCLGGEELRVAAAIVAKGRRYAGPFVLAPAARLAVPLLHLVALRHPGRAGMLAVLAALPLGLVHRVPGVAIRPAHALSLAGDGPIEVDGEIRGALPIAVELAAEPLLLVQPG
jgi:diacylglycerol kinase (ATP)